MKTKIFIRHFLILLTIVFFPSLKLIAQANEMDSLIYSKNLQTINGEIPVYYSAQCKMRAIESQHLLQNLASQYLTTGNHAFNLKLAVIDSAQWTGFWVSYGFFFISRGWIVIPGDLNFQRFSHLWGHYPYNDAIKKNLKKVSKDTEILLTETLYRFCIVHELGHYYNSNILNTTAPDRWTNEWMASYFTTDFLFQNDKKYLKAWSIFASTFAKEYKPKYKTLIDFNTIYAGVGLENFVWYHCMFQPMIEEIYAKFERDFMNSYARTFPKVTDPKKYTQEELMKTLDSLTNGITSKWIKIIENKE